MLEAGAAEYVGVDASESMLALAEGRLGRFGSSVRLVRGEFLEAPLEGLFDVVLALGLFDYLPEPHLHARRMRELCSGTLVASFPRWSWIKGPIRKVRYEIVSDCPIFNYTERELRLMLGASGFSRVEFPHRGRSGFVVYGVVEPSEARTKEPAPAGPAS